MSQTGLWFLKYCWNDLQIITNLHGPFDAVETHAGMHNRDF